MRSSNQPLWVATWEGRSAKCVLSRNPLGFAICILWGTLPIHVQTHLDEDSARADARRLRERLADLGWIDKDGRTSS